MQHALEFSFSLLLMQREADKIISVEASREFAGKIKENCTLKIWDGLYHEIHNESEKEEVFKFIINWVNKKILE